MSRVIRHDTITLHPEVNEDVFIVFMRSELVPSFSGCYQGPTRTSIADLKGQSLIKDARQRRKYVWITIWDGNPESVRGAMFEHTRMVRLEAAEVMLKKLESFGKRSVEKVFSELINIKVATNH